MEYAPNATHSNVADVPRIAKVLTSAQLVEDAQALLVFEPAVSLPRFVSGELPDLG